MRAGPPLLLVFLTGLSLTAQAPTFRGGVETVAVYATVQDQGGRLVPDLDKTDFEILEDGRPRPIVVFSRDPQPLSIAMMLDNSTSHRVATVMSTTGDPGPWAPGFVGGAAASLREALMAFTDALGPGDRVSVGSFGLEISVGANLTRDRFEVARVLDEEMWSGGGTPLWQALSAAMTSLASEPGRHVVLTFTDGRDTGNLPGWKGNQATVARQAASGGVMIYAVNWASRDPARLALSKEIEALASSTGGGYLLYERNENLTATFARVADELRHQYLIGFEPSATDGAEHRIEVRASRPGTNVRARKRYVASK